MMAPHSPAAFINAIHEDGTKAEAVKWLQLTWNDYCAAKARAAELEKAIRDANESLRYSEGISLLHYMDERSPTGVLIAEVIS